MFLIWTDLGSTNHQTDAEVEDTYNVCVDAVKTFKSNIASLDVDNAAREVAGKVANKFAKEGTVILVIRDPLHYIDLCSKDFSKTYCVTHVLHDATKV